MTAIPKITAPLTAEELRDALLAITNSSIQPVSGPLTDAQLRATAVPVSVASVPSHAVTGPLTDTQLRASDVKVTLDGEPVQIAYGAAVATVEARKQTPTGNALNVQIGPGDVISNIPVFLDFEHHQIHEGESYLAQDPQLSIGSATVKYSFTVPTFVNTIYGPHVVISCDVYNGNCRVELYEGSTFTGGSTVAVKNRNRNSAAVAGSTIKTGVTSTDGTLIKSFFAGGGKTTSGASRPASEMVYKSNTIYRIDVVGLAAGTQAIIGFEWYEDLGV